MLTPAEAVNKMRLALESLPDNNAVVGMRRLGLGPLIDRMPGGLFQLVGEAGWQQ